ncbi:MAG: hypothetical protein E7448_03070 [Ruminococcaceae bacterium]|nr:hypothetical protein [Oscillospiraceae bacterium]
MKILAALLILCLCVGLCACIGNPPFPIEPSLGGSEITTTEIEDNPLVGAWVSFEESSDFSTILVINENNTFYMVGEGYDNSTYKNHVELIQGTYEITNDRLRLTTKTNPVTDEEGTFSVSNGILSINGSPMYQKLETGFGALNSVIGTWKEYKSGEFRFAMGSGHSIISSITLFNDGSYTTNPAINYGQYRLMQDGRAIQIYSSNGRYEELIFITHLGFNLIIFNGPDGSYILQRVSE